MGLARLNPEEKAQSKVPQWAEFLQWAKSRSSNAFGKSVCCGCACSVL